MDGAALVCVSLTGLLAPAHADLVSKIALPPEFGELAMMGWLLIWGVRKVPAADGAV